MAPANGLMQRFANRLFINMQSIDVAVTAREANRILQSITTIDELLERFSEFVASVMGTDRIAIYLTADQALDRVYPLPDVHDRCPSSIDFPDQLVSALSGGARAVVKEEVLRRRASDPHWKAAQRLKDFEVSVAVAIRSKGQLVGMMLVGTRLSGRIYGAVEQEVLQILCNELAVAIENSKLYTQVQNGKIYNDNLVDNLVSGVIAADKNGNVTVFNREAQRITRLHPDMVLHHSINFLPGPLAAAIRSTLATGKAERDISAKIVHDEEDEVPIRLGSTIFRSHTGDVLGVLCVFNDLTQVRKLEMQVRHTDRLASIGTLSAGMAHEIKNPLVTIKTFTQLLPERYDDEDFRDTFSSLLSHEVGRIDRIVNQLLNFARPSKPSLAPDHMHRIITACTDLIQEQLKQKQIRLEMILRAENDLVYADADQLEQVYVNFFLNALDAMSELKEGTLTITTNVVERNHAEDSTLEAKRYQAQGIEVCVSDTGKGISQDNLARIFDPFFTTKGEGTGLGLAVTHGILMEHRAVVNVDSDGRSGTTFRVVFPLLRRQAACGYVGFVCYAR